MTNNKPDKKLKKVLSISLGEKKILWLSNVNKYLLVIPPTDKIIALLYSGENEKSIVKYCVEKLSFSSAEAIQTVEVIKRNLNNIASVNSTGSVLNNKNITCPSFKCKRYYRINQIVFFIEYETPEIEYLVHPKFAHLEIPKNVNVKHHFQLFFFNSEIMLMVNGKTIGSWKKELEHFMTGKVSMEILQKIYGNKENDWMAVFHAAGISNRKESILFLGDSGNGKSTLSAILLASGFDVLADDFLPIESKTLKICSFPAAISVKKHAIDLLIPSFPELNNAKEYSYPLFNKTVRYLSNPKSSTGVPKKVRCKALVFVKYEAGAKIKFEPLDQEVAFQKLVPDSWISPKEQNAIQFLNWFKKLPTYELRYSNNDAMIKTIKNIFDEL